MDVCGLGVLCCLKRHQPPRNLHTRELPQVQLDTGNMGNEVVIVKSGKRICGSGAALGTAPILQNKGYFEVKIQSGGIWGIGVATKNCDLNKIPLGSNPESWVLRSDGTAATRNVVVHRVSIVPEEGETLACAFDHVELNFYLNGKHLHCPLTGFKGTVYPVLYERPTSGTNFLKKVMENVIDRANKGIATPGDNEVLNYLSTVKLLKNRICGNHGLSGKISTPSSTKKQSTTSLPSTGNNESSAIPTATATSFPKTTRGVPRKTTIQTTPLTMLKTTRKPSLDVSKITNKAPESQAMVVDVDNDDETGNDIVMNDVIEEDRDETIEESLPKMTTVKAELSTKPITELPQNIRTRRSKPPRPSKRPSRPPRPSYKSGSPPRPSKRYTYGTLKQSTLLDTDLTDKGDFLAKKTFSSNKLNREKGYSINDQPHHGTELKELAAIDAFEERIRALKSEDENNDERSKSLSTINNLEREKQSTIKELLNKYKNKETEHKSENMKVPKDNSAEKQTNSMDTVVYVRNKRHGLNGNMKTEISSKTAIPVTSATRLPRTRHLTNSRTTRKPSLVLPKKTTKASTGMTVDTYDDAVNVRNNIFALNDEFEKDADEIEETHTVYVSLIETSTPPPSTPDNSENIPTRLLKPAKPSQRLTNVPPSRKSSFSPPPSKRHKSGTLKQSSLVETDLINKVDHLAQKKVDKLSRETGYEPEILLPGNNRNAMKNDVYHSNDLPSDGNHLEGEPSGISSVDRVHGKEVDTTLGEGEVSYDSTSENLDDGSVQQLESQTTNNGIANKDESTRNEYSYNSKLNKKLADIKMKRTKAKETDSMDTPLRVGNSQNSETVTGNLNLDDNTQSKRSASTSHLLDITDDKELDALLQEDKFNSKSYLKHEEAGVGKEVQNKRARTTSEMENETRNEKDLNIIENNKGNGNLKKNTKGLLMKPDQLAKQSPQLHRQSTEDKNGSPLLNQQSTEDGRVSVYEDLIN